MHIYTCTNIYIDAYIHIHIYTRSDVLLADALPLNKYVSVMRAYNMRITLYAHYTLYARIIHIQCNAHMYARITNTCTNIYINAYIHIHVYSLRDGLLADALPLNRYISVMRAYTYACKHMYKCLHNCIYTHVCIYTSRRTSR